MSARFIVLDGPDAAGTTTHARLLTERLRALGHDVVQTAEPTAGPIGARIREFLREGGVTPLALQLLFCADRAWHVDTVIRPALEAGKTVVTDRYWYSTIVYAEAQGLDAAPLRALSAAFPQPDAVVFTLPPLESCMVRLAKRSEHDLFEKEEVQRKIHAGYRAMAEADPRIRVVDTSGTKEEGSVLVAAAVGL